MTTAFAGRRGFSLIEITLVVALIGTIAAIAVPAYARYTETGRIVSATGEIADMALRIYQYKEINGVFPQSLAEAGITGVVDPWGEPYTYLKIEDEKKNATQARKDEFLKPLNSDFDLFSPGADNLFSKSLGDEVSQDDVVRAADGAFIGVAKDF